MDFLHHDLLNNMYFVSALIAMFILSALLYISQLIKQERHHAQREREKELEEQTRKDFISNINHEVRTPVNVISGMLHLLYQQNLDQQTKQYIDKIKIANTDIKNVIDDALDFNRLSSGSITSNIQEINLYNFIDSLKESFNIAAQQKKLKISFIIDEKIPKRVQADVYLLKSICTKLLDNAIKFTDSGQIILKVSLIRGNDSVVELKFQIRDTGIGMTKDQVRNISQAFKQGDGSKTRSYGGIGIGIFLTEKMLAAMKSHLKIDTQLDRGTTVSFDIMLSYIGDDLSDAEICKGKKIMFVDDDIINREIGKSLLSKLEAEATIFSSGREVLDNINSTYDLLIIDIKMPGMDGTEVAEKLNGYGYVNLPIIALTGNSDEEDLEEYKQSGMVGCIAKPIDFDVMKGSIADVFKAKGKSIEFKKIHRDNLNTDSEIITFDPHKGLRLINNDEELYNGILDKFKTNFANTADKIYQLIEARDLKTCEILAHSVKGVSVNIGALPLSGLAKELEIVFKQGKKTDISRFSDELKKVITEIDHYLETHKVDSGPLVEKKTGGTSELKELLKGLKDSVTRNDPVKSKEILNEIKGYSFSDTINDSVTKLGNAMLSYDFIEAGKIIDTMNKSLEE